MFADGAGESEELFGQCVPGGDGLAVAVGVGGGPGGGEPPCPGVHGVVEEPQHRVELGGPGLSADRVGAHDVPAQGAVADHEPGVDGDPPFEGVEVFAEGGPGPVDAFLQGLEGHPFDLGHHAAGVVGVVGPVGVERGEGEPAVPTGDGGDAVVHGRGGVRVPEELGVVVGVGVDEAGGEHESGGVLRGHGLLGEVAGLGDDGDAPVADAEVGDVRGSTGAVHDGRSADEVVEHVGFPSDLYGMQPGCVRPRYAPRLAERRSGKTPLQLKPLRRSRSGDPGAAPAYAAVRNRVVRCTGSVSIFGITCSPISRIEFIVSSRLIPIGSPKLN